MYKIEISEYKGAILEENKKFYWVEKGATVSRLLYDFNLSEGDSVDYQNRKYKLVLKDSIFHDGFFKMIYSLDSLVITLTEGIGFNTNFLDQIFPNESFSYLQCFNKNGEFFNPDLSELEAALNQTLEDVETCGRSLIIQKQGNLFSEIDSIIRVMPATDLNKYFEPSNPQLNTWENTLRLLLIGDYDSAADSACAVGYHLINFTDTSDILDRTYFVLETADTNYWGTYVYNPDFCRPLVIQAPHAKRDLNTGLEGICLLYTSPSPRDRTRSRMPSSA